MVKVNSNSRSGYHTRTLRRLLSRNVTIKKQLMETQKREKRLLETIRKLEKTVENSQKQFERFRKTMMDEVTEMKTQNDNKDADLNNNNNQIANIVSENKKTLDQLDLRLQLHENTTYNGQILWKIDHFQQRRTQILSGKMNALHSAPSFTQLQQGYKFCLRIYPNGDGVGKGTHLSLFIVLMKSDFDNLLQWPFQKQVKFTLINQDNRVRDIVETMIPKMDSPSFQKPIGEMNVASGCPLFISLDRLQSEGFMKDDSLFINVVVE